MARFLMKGGDRDGEEVPITVGMVIGRRDEIPLTLKDVKISREHAGVVAVDGGLALKDLDSTNGCFVNGTRVSQARLSHGDRVRLGNTTMLFLDEESAAKAPEPKKRVQKRIDLNLPPPKKVNVKLKSTRNRSDKLRGESRSRGRRGR